MSIKAILPLPPKVSSTAAAVIESPVQEAQASPAPLSTDQLLTLIASMQQQLLAAQQSAATANERLAAAILETTKPREVVKTKEQLAKEENDKKFYEQAKELERRKKLNLELSRDNCVHIAGCNELSEERDVRGRTSILWHQTDAQVVVGICTNCQRIFRPDDAPDSQGRTYQFWRKQPSINRISMAGARQFMDPMRAMKESYLQDS